jgi:DNA invertase Pin-like site-specific DNA recombinase
MSRKASLEKHAKDAFIKRSFNKMKRVVYYARVSTEEEKQINALKNQIDDLESFIMANPDWDLKDKYVDEGKSGTTTLYRDEYNRMLNDMKSGKFDIIVIKDMSRLNRNQKDWFNFVDDLNDNDVKLYFYLDKKFYNEDEDDIYTSFQALINEQKSRGLSKNVRRAHAKRLEKAETPVTNGKMWGYEQKKGSHELIKREDEAELIREIFFLYTEKGYGVYKILNELVVPEEIAKRRKLVNGKMSHTTVERIIKNPAYMGKIAQGKLKKKSYKDKKLYPTDKDKWVYFDCPAIISEETFNKAQALRKTKLTDKFEDNRGKYAGRYPLSGKIKCGICGSTYMHTPLSMGYSIWVCRAYKERGLKGCTNIRIKETVLDDIIKNVIIPTSEERQKGRDTLIKALEESLNDPIQKDNLSVIEGKITRTRTLYDMNHDAGKLKEISDEEYRHHEARYRKDLDELEKQRAIILEKQRNRLTKYDRLVHIKNKVYDVTTEPIGEIIKDNVDQITVNPGRLTIVLCDNFTYEKDYPIYPASGQD